MLLLSAPRQDQEHGIIPEWHQRDVIMLSIANNAVGEEQGMI